MNKKLELTVQRESVIYQYDTAGIVDRTKFSEDFLDHVKYFTSKYGIMLSIRMQDPRDESNRRSSDEGFAGKPSTFSTKTNLMQSVAHGKIPLEIGLISSIYNIDDNKVPGAFAPDAQKVEDGDEIALNIRAYEKEKNILEIKKLRKRICYSVEAEIMQNGQKIGTINKHYIQEAETLSSILQKINFDGSYKFQKIENGHLYITYDGTIQKEYNIMINLNDIYPPKGTEALQDNPFENIKNLEDLEKIINDHKEKTNLAKFHAPLFFEQAVDNNQENKVYVPLMVHAGYNGQALTSDADLGHIGTPLNLPKSARFCFQSKKMPVEDYLTKIDDFIKDLHRISLGAKEEPGNPFSPQAFAKSAERALAYYRDHSKELQENTVGASTVYSMIMQYLFNYDDSDEWPAIKEEIMWMHGAEEIHPAAQPEIFKGMLVSWNDKFYITSDEKAYLDLLLEDPNMLKNQELGVHPYWLRDRPEEVQGVNLSEYWLDIIKIQALNKIFEAQQSCNDFFENLIFQITSLPRKDSVNEHAVTKILQIQETVISLDKNLDIIQQEINNVYNKYAKDRVRPKLIRTKSNKLFT